MDAEKRRVAIARFIAENDGADVAMLAKHFSVSPITIRRDRKILAAQNKIAVTHGGAVPIEYLMYQELPYSQKVNINLEKKKSIAKQAVSFISDDSCIILDAGTTTLELAKLLIHKKLTVITVDLHIALFLSQFPSIRVYTPGGEVNKEIQCQLDNHSMQYLESVNASISFIGTAVWDDFKGVTSSTISKQAIKRTIIEHAETAILLADSSKYGLCNPWNVTSLKSFTHIITDDGLSTDDCQEINQAGGNLILAKRE